MKVTLPNNGFGVAIILLVIVLFAAVAFTTSLWVIGLFAPWWVATPFAAFITVNSLLFTVKTK